VATEQLELQAPPSNERALELWLQHAAGLILVEDVRSYAFSQVDPSLSEEARAAARKAIDDALYGLMMVIDGVSGSLRSREHSVELSVRVKLSDCDGVVLSDQDLREGDGMCMGYHGWLAGDYGDHLVATPVAARLGSRA
jgi:hypothetical protein